MTTLQRKNEICLGVNVAKAEKSSHMRYGVSLSLFTVENQQPNSKQEEVQRLSREGVESQAIGGSKWWTPYMGEDIVHTLSKDRGARNSAGQA